jgi:cardiolipin synthase
MECSRVRKCQAWIITSLFLALFTLDFVYAIPAKFGLSPDNSQSLLVDTISSAKKSLVVNIYEFDSPIIADSIVGRVNAGVKVSLLAETKLANGDYSESMRKALRKVLTAMRKKTGNKMFLKVDKTRYRFNHAKYVIADATHVLVSSENFKESGHPTAGTVGNRGWAVVVSNKALARELKAAFDEDTQVSKGDVKLVSSIPAGGRKSRPAPSPEQRRAPEIPSLEGEIDSVELVTAPGALDALVELFRSAKNNLEVEFMSLPPNWGADESPLVTEIIEAARRGVDVRVLLNKPFGSDDVKNTQTATLLETLGQCERGLNLTARIIDANGAGVKIIHNKGILVDGERTLVSSINGTQNSVTNNREIAVLLEGTEAAEYYGEAFDFDWNVSPQLKVEGCAQAFSPTFLPALQRRGLIME